MILSEISDSESLDIERIKAVIQLNFLSLNAILKQYLLLLVF